MLLRSNRRIGILAKASNHRRFGIDELELYAFIFSCWFSFYAARKTFLLKYHPLFFPWNPGLGFARLSTWLALAVAFVTIFRFSASDITSNPVYIVFYLVLGYAVVKGCGQLDPVYRISYRVNVVERRNSVAGFYLGARTLAIAQIFAGSMIGEGPGFYVVVGFFLMGWGALEGIVYLLARQRGWDVRSAVCRAEAGKAAVISAWYVALSLVLKTACAGDFLGWGPGSVDFLRKAFPVIGIILISVPFGLRGGKDGPKSANSPETTLILLFAALFLWKDYLFRWNP